MAHVLVILFSVFAVCTAFAGEHGRFELKEGDRVIFVGDSFIENERHAGWIELMLTTRFSDRRVVFRNLGWSADTPAGASRAGLSQYPAGKEPPDEGRRELIRQIRETKPTVIIFGYGMASSFAGEAGLAAFESDYSWLLDEVVKSDPRIRCVLVGPIPHERLGAPWPEPASHDAQIRRYDSIVRSVAARRGLPYVSLHDALQKTPPEDPFSENGIHLSPRGYRRVSELIEDQLLGSVGAWRTSSRTDQLRQTIVRKNDWFHHKWRPNNFVYSFGFLKGHQRQDFRDEILSFDTYVAAEETQIEHLRTLTVDEGRSVRATAADPTDSAASQRKAAALATTTAYGLVIPRGATTSGVQEDPRFEVAEGLEVMLWAKNPLLRKPIHMNFDPEGRLWVVTSEIYPHLAPGQSASDKLIILEDTAGTGRADKVTTFADDLLIPTSVEPGDGGAYVTQASDLIHLRDTNGDGKADVRRVVLRGFGTEDGHQVVHGLRWGPEGRLYLNQSVYTRSHIETPHGIVRHTAGGIFRLDPRSQQLEVYYRGFVNPWGHQFDNYGQSFLTDGADHLGVNWGVPGATYNTLAPARRILQSVSAGSYPKFIGAEIIRSQHFPDDWQGDVITCDFRAHTVVRFKLNEQGTAYATQEMPPVLRSTDQHFRPLDVKLGPDGALYLVDWSNPIIQHSGVEFREPRRDREHGRIWRISAKGRTPLPVNRFAAKQNAELFTALLSVNSYDREQARRVLRERGFARVKSDLEKWIQSRPGDEALLQAAWLYQAFDRVARTLLDDLLVAKDHRIRAAAVRLLPAKDARESLAACMKDSHSRVRLEAIRGLGRVGTVDALDLALSALQQPMDAFLDYALWLTVNELAAPWQAAVKSGRWSASGREKQLEFVLNAVEPKMAGEVLGRLLGDGNIPEENAWIELVGRAGEPVELQRLYQQVSSGGFGDAATVRALKALADAARIRSALPPDGHQDLAKLLTTRTGDIRLAAIQLAAEWKSATLVPDLLAIASAQDIDAPHRSAALAALRATGGPAVVEGLSRLARTTPNALVRRDAVVALAALNFESVLPDVMAVLSTTTAPAEGETLWRALLSIPEAGKKIASALDHHSLPAAVARAGLKPAREGHRHPALVEKLSKFAGLAGTTHHVSKDELRALAHEAETAGDAARGERIYRRPELSCVACHAIGGAGGNVGPDLTGIGASAPADYLLESLVDPNAQIKQGYQSVMLETKDRRQISGTVLRETADEVRIRDAAGNETAIALQNIVQRTNVGSLMPAGLIDSLLPDERRDLIKFLSALGKPGDFNAAQSGVARFWRLYAVVSRLQLIPLESIVGGDFTLEDWHPTYSLAKGTLPRESLEALLPTRGAPLRGLFAAVQFDSARGGTAKFELTAETKGIWINGQPVKRGRTFNVEAKAGTNVLVVQLFESDRARLPDAMKLTSRDVTFLSR